MTNEEIAELQRRNREFAETEIGKAFHRFESAHSRYWQMDNSETVSYRRLSDLDAAAKEARDKLVSLLRPLAGLKD